MLFLSLLDAILLHNFLTHRHFTHISGNVVKEDSPPKEIRPPPGKGRNLGEFRGPKRSRIPWEICKRGPNIRGQKGAEHSSKGGKIS